MNRISHKKSGRGFTSDADKAFETAVAAAASSQSKASWRLRKQAGFTSCAVQAHEAVVAAATSSGSKASWSLRKQRGFTLIIAMLVIGIVLSIGISILNITLKEFLLSGIARESQIAFSAADAGMECALYWDGFGRDAFNVAAVPSTIECGGADVEIYGGGSNALVGGEDYGDPNEFQLTWGTPELCARVEVTKHDSTTLGACPAGVTCTLVVSRGYNTCDLDNPRTVERALRARY